LGEVALFRSISIHRHPRTSGGSLQFDFVVSARDYVETIGTLAIRIPNLNLTAEDNANDEISRIEARIEELAEISERCRKIILVSKAAIGGGCALLLLMMLGLLGSNAAAALGSIAVVLGGIVSLGSNVSTLQQTMAAISAAEGLRSDLISRIDLRVVGDGALKLL
jgi:hypothetical protein